MWTKKKNVTNEQNQRGSRSQVYNYVLPYTWVVWPNSRIISTKKIFQSLA